MFRRHGLTAKSSPRRADEHFWPRQVFKDAAACCVLLFAVIAISWYRPAELGPPAQPTESYGAARPEWYFLFLFELLKKFQSSVFIGAIVIPAAVMAFLFAMPLIARVRYLHAVNVAALLVLIAGAGYLTYEAVDHDNYHLSHPNPPDDSAQRALWQERVETAEKFHAAKEQQHREYQRVHQLIQNIGIPRNGAAAGLVDVDPEIQGPRIFRRNCASCHSYLDASGEGIAGPQPPPDWDGVTPYGAPNLFEFASRERLTRFLSAEGIVSSDNFGTCAHGLKDEDGAFKSGGMVEWVQDMLAEPGDELPSVVVALSAEAKLKAQKEIDAQAEQEGTLEAGRTAITDTFLCTDCHTFNGDGGQEAPDLTGYFSYDWLYAFISNPADERFYGENNDRMPAFAAHPDAPERNLLSHHEIDMLVRWLRGDERDSANSPQLRQPSEANPPAP
jgi:ubiquinol-cytochrome c reductase cytochrome b subunit